MAFWGKAFCGKIHNNYIKFNSLIPEATCITILRERICIDKRSIQKCVYYKMTIKCQEVQAVMDFLNKYC